MKKSFVVGLFLIAISLLLGLLVFYPIIKQETRYWFFTAFNNQTNYNNIVVDTSGSLNTSQNDKKNVIVAADKNFSVVIPKIGANSKIIKNVDPFNSHEYQVALSKGVAMAKGSALPLSGKNTFLFAHSSDNFINANTYNSVFYLLYKLDINDNVYLVYKGKVVKYKVVKKIYVDSKSTNYISADYGENTVTLMTCWPPGTNLKRLIIVAKLVN